MSDQELARQDVQLRLACSVGDSPTGGTVRTLLAWVASVEETDQDIVTPWLLRTMDTPNMPGGGLLLLTFTPLKGMRPLIQSF
jgi:hypothetical protein